MGSKGRKTEKNSNYRGATRAGSTKEEANYDSNDEIGRRAPRRRQTEATSRIYIEEETSRKYIEEIGRRSGRRWASNHASGEYRR